LQDVNLVTGWREAWELPPSPPPLPSPVKGEGNRFVIVRG